MARKYWKGGKASYKGHWNQADNWQQADGSATTVPAAGDVVVFDGRSGVCDLADTDQDLGQHWNCCKGIGYTDTGQLELEAIVICGDYTGTIGINAADTIDPLHISIADDGMIIYRGTADCYIRVAADDLAHAHRHG